MKEYDIKIKNGCDIRFFGTDNNTIVIPADVKMDTDRDQVDIDIKADTKVEIGIPEKAEHIELGIEDANLKIENISWERIEIDAKGQINIEMNNVDGSIDVNMAGGFAELIVPADYSFVTRCEGRNNTIECDIPTDPSSANVIELNGKNTTLVIKRKD